MGKMTERVKTMIRNWLEIQPAPITSVSLYESVPYELRVIECLMWYRGEAAELDQFYKQISNDHVTREMFWAVNTAKTRKIHTGLPAMIVDTLAYLVKADMDAVDLKGNGADKWDAICTDDNFDFTDIVGKGIVGALTAGDGAWKITVNAAVSEVPIAEFYTAERVEYEIRHGIICGVNFITDIPQERKVLKLREKYRKGSVTYELFDGDRQLSAETVRQITGLSDVHYSDRSDILLAVPFKIFDNAKEPCRGKSILESKIDDFDAFDEILSQWLDAYRKGRAQKYIPENLIPRDIYNGKLRPHNPFDNEYVTVNSVLEAKAARMTPYVLFSRKSRMRRFCRGIRIILTFACKALFHPLRSA